MTQAIKTNKQLLKLAIKTYKISNQDHRPLKTNTIKNNKNKANQEKKEGGTLIIRPY